MPSGLTCRELVEFLAEYLEGRLPAEQRARFDRHLAGCPDCARYARSYQDSVRLARSVFARPDDPVPAEVPEELVRAIVEARGREP